jgi:hypothetical protein
MEDLFFQREELMSTGVLDRIESAWAKDSILDLSDIETAQKDSLELHHKYHKIFNTVKMKLKRLESEYAKLSFLRTEYYLGNLDRDTLKAYDWKPNQRIVIKTDMAQRLAADDILIDKGLEVAEMAQAANFLDNIIRHINNRGFAIKNVVESRKFNNGN